MIQWIGRDNLIVIVLAAVVVMAMMVSRLPGCSGKREIEPYVSPVQEEEVAEEIVVHVAGMVRQPGIYVLEVGARVADAVQAAGGALPEADLDRLNLAARVVDGQRVYVPGTDEGSGGSGVVDVNVAGARELESLPGIGPALAQRIVDYRESNGRFAVLEDLIKVPGIGASIVERIRELVVIN